MADTRNSRDDLLAKKRERKKEIKTKADKQTKKNRIIFACIAVVLALFAILVIGYKVITSGFVERHTTAVKSENNKVSVAMMNYYFNANYNMYSQYFSSSDSSDTSFADSVKEHGEYYDYLMTITKSQVEQYLTYAEMAKAEGIKLEKEDKDEINEAINNLKETKNSFEEQNSSYKYMTFNTFLETIYGKGVNESVVRKALSLSQIASKYQEWKLDQLGASYTDADYDAYYEENKDDYTLVDYMMYSFEVPADTADAADAEAADGTTEDAVDAAAADAEAAEDAVDATDDTVDKEDALDAAEDTVDAADAVDDTVDAADAADDTADDAEDVAAADDAEDVAEAEEDTKSAEEKANELAATKTVDEYKAYMKTILLAEAVANTADGEEVDEAAVDTKVEGLESKEVAKSTVTDEDLAAWLYADDAKVGATKIVKNDEGSKYSVYMITKTSYRDEEITKKAAYIDITSSNNDGDSEAKAKEIMDKWNAGDKTEEAFLALAEEYAATHQHEISVGLTRDAEYGEWLYEDGRKVGDVGTVTTDTTTYIVYFAGDDLETWKTKVRDAKSGDDLAELVKAFQSDHNFSGAETPSSVIFVDKAVAKVTSIVEQ
ncbi:MAG: hypothetical protein IJQ80_08460 [Clostridia bacterium]|nr:hypothetical protein [Clostridia bacterium]